MKHIASRKNTAVNCRRCGRSIPRGPGSGKGRKLYCSPECREAIDNDHSFGDYAITAEDIEEHLK